MLAQTANHNLIILNALKIKEREILALTAAPNQQQQLLKKYQEGLNKIYLASPITPHDDVKARVIKIVEIRAKWLELQAGS